MRGMAAKREPVRDAPVAAVTDRNPILAYSCSYLVIAHWAKARREEPRWMENRAVGFRTGQYSKPRRTIRSIPCFLIAVAIPQRSVRAYRQCGCAAGEAGLATAAGRDRRRANRASSAAA